MRDEPYRRTLRQVQRKRLISVDYSVLTFWRVNGMDDAQLR